MTLPHIPSDTQAASSLSATRVRPANRALVALSYLAIRPQTPRQALIALGKSTRSRTGAQLARKLIRLSSAMMATNLELSYSAVAMRQMMSLAPAANHPVRVSYFYPQMFPDYADHESESCFSSERSKRADF